MTVTNSQVKEQPTIPSTPAKGVDFFTPQQVPGAGTANGVSSEGLSLPKIFQPLKIRGVTLQNRIMLSPLCQYSSQDGHLTDWHVAHLGGIASRGPGLTMIEATSVTPEGRISPEDSGLWQDSQIAPLKRVVDFVHSQNQLIAIQLGHAGRKASSVSPFLSSIGQYATKEANGWPDRVYGPSAIPWDENHAPTIEMTEQDIEDFKQAYVASVKRALTAGVDVIEIHAAHGYLLSSFLSPAANQRTDKYGGSFENRIRLIVETAELTRAAIPDSMPLFLRVNATDWLEEQNEVVGWTLEETVKLADILADKGVDLLDVSSGGNHPLQHPHTRPGYHVPFSKAVKEKVGDRMLVSSVGLITEGPQAEQILQEGLDLVVVGRAFQKDPSLVWTWADQLNVKVWKAGQIGWGFDGRGLRAGKQGETKTDADYS